MKKQISLLLTAVLAVGSTIGVYGANFSDINDIPWAGAATYINEVADAGIMVGSTVEGKQVFRGKEPVTLCEVTQLVYSLLEKTGNLKPGNDLEAKWAQVMSGYNIPTWAQKGVSYCLENNIVAAGDLKAFMSDTKGLEAQRAQVAYIVGRGLQTVDGSLSGGGAVTFKDATQISAIAIPYVQMLNTQGILSGDTDGNFNPDVTINRAEMAVVISKSFKKLNEIKASTDTVVPPTTTPVAPGSDSAVPPGIDSAVPNTQGNSNEMPAIIGLGNTTGAVKEVQENGANRLIVLSGSNGDVGYMGAADMAITYSDGATGVLSEVVAGDNVTIVYESAKLVSLINNSVKKVEEAPAVDVKTKGVISDLTNKKIRISGGDYLYVSRDTTITLDGKTRDINYLVDAFDEEDEIYAELEVDTNSDVTHITAKIEESSSDDGTISSISTSEIKVGGKSYTVADESDLTIEVVDGSSTIDDLDDLIDAVKLDKKKIEVSVTEKSDEVTKIKGSVIEMTAELTSVTPGSDKIEVKSDDGNRFTYTCKSSLDIDVDNDDMSLKELEDYHGDEGDFTVELTFSDGKVTEIKD